MAELRASGRGLSEALLEQLHVLSEHVRLVAGVDAQADCVSRT